MPQQAVANGIGHRLDLRTKLARALSWPMKNPSVGVTAIGTPPCARRTTAAGDPFPTAAARAGGKQSPTGSGTAQTGVILGRAGGASRNQPTARPVPPALVRCSAA